MTGRVGRVFGIARTGTALIAAAVALAFSPVWAPASTSLHAQDFRCERGDRELRALSFDGHSEFTVADLRTVVVTTPSSFGGLPLLGRRRCIDPEEVGRDIQRLELLYRKRGFQDVQVDTLVTDVANGVIELAFLIDEGAPMRVNSRVIRGLDGVPGSASMIAGFPLRENGLFDRNALESGRDSLVRRLRNEGWPTAEALLAYTTDEAARVADVEITVVPGTRARLGRVRVVIDSLGGTPSVQDATIRRTMGLREGDWFNARSLITAQRSLYQLDAFRRVDLTVDQDLAAGDSVVDITVRLLEGDRYAAQGGLGWATLDCMRMQGSFTDRDFLPWAPRLEVTARVSKVGIGAPLDGAEGLCQQQARVDPYSRTLNYYTGITLRQPVTVRRSRVPTLSIFSSTLSEYRAFLRRTPIGGAVSVTNPLQGRFPSTISYQVELGRTDAEPAFFCAVFNSCDPESTAFLQRTTRLAAIGYSVARETLDDPLRPTSGTTLRLDLRHASTLVGSDPSQQFTRAIGDATWYTSLPAGATLLAHVRGGLVFGGGARPQLGGFIPPQERLYAGGPTTVRGFRQNELGPAVYIVEGFRTVIEGDDTFFRADSATFAERVVPVGGNTLVVGNLEVQVPSPVLGGLLSWAAFTDVGRLWSRGEVPGGQVVGDERRLKFTPGMGVRIVSPFGAIRIDLGYNGYSFPAGAAYFNAPLEAGIAPLYCVSPGNTLVVTPPGNGTAAPPVQESGPCPASYRPSQGRGILGRLNPSIWIGQAF